MDDFDLIKRRWKPNKIFSIFCVVAAAAAAAAAVAGAAAAGAAADKVWGCMRQLL